jgi:hypothetical protein
MLEVYQKLLSEIRATYTIEDIIEMTEFARKEVTND